MQKSVPKPHTSEIRAAHPNQKKSWIPLSPGMTQKEAGPQYTSPVPTIAGKRSNFIIFLSKFSVWEL